MITENNGEQSVAEPHYVNPRKIDGAIIYISWAIKSSSLLNDPRRMGRLRSCDRQLRKAQENCQTASNIEELIQQRLGIQILFGKLFLGYAALYLTRRKVGEPGKNMARSTRSLERAEQAFKEALRIKPDHIKTQLRLMRVKIIQAQTGLEDKKGKLLDDAYDLFEKVQELVSKRAISYKIYCAEAELYLGTAYLFPQYAGAMLKRTRIAMNHALEASAKARKPVERMCLSYFGQPNLPDYSADFVRRRAEATKPSGRLNNR